MGRQTLQRTNTYVAATRPPSEPLPGNACDCQIHVYGDRAKYPIRVAKPLYDPPDATLEHSQRMHRTLGVDRVVIVQASVYKTDHSLLVDVLRRVPRDRYRGVAIIDDSVTDAELLRLHEAGVRGARFNFWKALGLDLDLQSFRRSLDRIRGYGWHAKIFFTPEQLVELHEEFTKIRTPAVIDHMGQLDFSKGLAQPAARLLLGLLAQENWWMMLSNADRWSASNAPPWSDAVPFARACYELAPDRCIWSTDWPHVNYEKPMPNDADLVELLYRYFPDREARQKVLVDNPARLYGFD